MSILQHLSKPLNRFQNTQVLAGTPWKTNGWNLKYSFEKEKASSKTFLFRVPCSIFGVYSCFLNPFSACWIEIPRQSSNAEGLGVVAVGRLFFWCSSTLKIEIELESKNFQDGLLLE